MSGRSCREATHHLRLVFEKILKTIQNMVKKLTNPRAIILSVKNMVVGTCGGELFNSVLFIETETSDLVD